MLNVYPFFLNEKKEIHKYLKIRRKKEYNYSLFDCKKLEIIYPLLSPFLWLFPKGKNTSSLKEITVRREGPQLSLPPPLSGNSLASLPMYTLILIFTLFSTAQIILMRVFSICCLFDLINLLHWLLGYFVRTNPYFLCEP